MEQNATPRYTPRPVRPRMLKDRAFLMVCIGSALFAVLVLIILLASIFYSGGSRLGIEFLTNNNSSTSPEQAGIKSALIGSIWLLIIAAGTAIPFGVGTAILLEEYQPKHRVLGWLHGFIQTNITNLAGVPSIVYGILGVALFATMTLIHMPGTMNQPIFTIGEKYYFEYRDVAGNQYYTKGIEPKYVKQQRETANGKMVTFYDDVTTGDFPLASAGMTFYTSPSLRETAEAKVLPEDELAPIKARIGQNLSSIEDTIRDGIESARTSRRGPVVMDEARAGEIAEQAFVDTQLKADTAELIAITKEQLIKMDGMESSDLRGARRDLVAELEAAELKAAGVSGLIIEGQRPQRRADKAWYYLQLPFGRSVLTGGLTLMLVILPIIIVASQESIRAVPQSMRHGCLALGGTKWQSISKVVLPAAIPGICTGSILAMSRAIGEAAPIILMGAVLITYLPGNLMDNFSAMPLQIYNWTAEPDPEFRRTAAAGIIVLLAVLLTFNAIAVFIRQKLSKRY